MSTEATEITLGDIFAIREAVKGQEVEMSMKRIAISVTLSANEKKQFELNKERLAASVNRLAIILDRLNKNQTNFEYLKSSGKYLAALITKFADEIRSEGITGEAVITATKELSKSIYAYILEAENEICKNSRTMRARTFKERITEWPYWNMVFCGFSLLVATISVVSHDSNPFAYGQSMAGTFARAIAPFLHVNGLVAELGVMLGVMQEGGDGKMYYQPSDNRVFRFIGTVNDGVQSVISSAVAAVFGGGIFTILAVRYAVSFAMSNRSRVSAGVQYLYTLFAASDARVDISKILEPLSRIEGLGLDEAIAQCDRATKPMVQVAKAELVRQKRRVQPPRTKKRRDGDENMKEEEEGDGDRARSSSRRRMRR
jgi:ribosomal protein L12E/L44/L45/RPP1/RPP2